MPVPKIVVAASSPPFHDNVMPHQGQSSSDNDLNTQHEHSSVEHEAQSSNDNDQDSEHENSPADNDGSSITSSANSSSSSSVSSSSVSAGPATGLLLYSDDSSLDDSLDNVSGIGGHSSVAGLTDADMQDVLFNQQMQSLLPHSSPHLSVPHSTAPECQHPSNDASSAAPNDDTVSLLPGCVANPVNVPAPLVSAVGSTMVFPVTDTRLSNHCISEAETCQLAILDLCRFAGCPRYFFDALMKLLTELQAKYHFDPSTMKITHHTLVNRLLKRFPTPVPQPVNVVLESTDPDNRHDIHYVRNARETAQAMTFNFAELARDLFSNMSITGNIKNLCVNPPTEDNPDAPWQEYVGHPSQRGEILGASWYKEVWKNIRVDDLYKDVPHLFVSPVLIYVDKTGVGPLQRHGMEPVAFTMAVFTRLIRNNWWAWRVLGYIPDLEQKSSAQKRSSRQTKSGAGRSARNYHKCLREVLRSLVDVQRSGPIAMNIRVGDSVKRCNVVFPVAFISQDGKSKDMATGRYGAYSKTKRIHPMCVVPQSQADDHEFNCQACWVNQKVMEDKLLASGVVKPGDQGITDAVSPTNRTVTTTAQKQAEEWLKNNSQNLVWPAFFDVWFGGVERGLYRCNPEDMMHAFKEGILSKSLKVFVLPYPDSQKAKIDAFALNVFDGLRSTEKKRVFPRFSLAHGITNMTLNTAEEWVGLALILYIVTLTHEGKELLEYRFPGVDADGKVRAKQGRGKKRKRTAKAKDRNMPTTCDQLMSSRADDVDLGNDEEPQLADPSALPPEPDHFRQLLETYLCFYAWFTKGDPYDCAGECEQQTIDRWWAACSEMMRQCKTILPAIKGDGWKLQKFHAHLHVAYNIMDFGCPMNWDTGVGESALKYWCKNMADTAQKRGPSIFMEQVASRLHETMSFEKAVHHFDIIQRDSHPTQQILFRTLRNRWENVNLRHDEHDEEHIRKIKGRAELSIRNREEAEEEAVWNVEPGGQLPLRTALDLGLDEDDRSTQCEEEEKGRFVDQHPQYIVTIKKSKIQPTGFGDSLFRSVVAARHQKKKYCQRSKRSGLVVGTHKHRSKTFEPRHGTSPDGVTSPNERIAAAGAASRRDELGEYPGIVDLDKALTVADEYLDSCVRATPGITARWKGAVGNRKGQREIHPLVTRFFSDIIVSPNNYPDGFRLPLQPADNPDDVKVNGYTEYKRGDLFVRSHPNYRSNGAWYDWVLAEFEVIEANGHKSLQRFPCKVISLFADPQTREPLALVHCATAIDPDSESVVICERWLMEYSQPLSYGEGTWHVHPVIRCVRCSSFLKTLMVIETDRKLSETVELPIKRATSEPSPPSLFSLLDNTDRFVAFVILDMATVWSQHFTASPAEYEQIKQTEALR